MPTTSRDVPEVRAAIFEDTDLSADLKLFALAAIHLHETADERKRVKEFRRSPWPYRALRLAGRKGTDEELGWPLVSLIEKDIPKYRPDMDTRPSCMGVLLRPAGAPCRAKVTGYGMIPNPMTGERTYAGACSRHRDVFDNAQRAAWRAWKANGEPEPKPNSGGLLLRYFTRGIEPLYEWADVRGRGKRLATYRRGDVVAEAPVRPLAPVTDLASRRPDAAPTRTAVLAPAPDGALFALPAREENDGTPGDR